MNKLSLLLFLFFFSSLTQASVDRIEIKDFSFNYDGQVGQGYFKKLILNTSKFGVSANDYQVDLMKESDSMTILKPDTKIKLQTVEGDLLSSMGQIEVSGLNVKLLRESQLSLTVDKALIDIGSGLQNFDQLSLRCKSGVNRNGDVFSFLLPCMTYGVFYIPELSFANESKQTLKHAFDISSFADYYLEQGDQFNVSNLVPKKVSQVLMNINKNKFSFKAKVKILVELNLKAQGEIYYHNMSSELEIKLDKVKLAFLGITKKVLKTIEEAGLNNVRVSGHSIFIKI